MVLAPIGYLGYIVFAGIRLGSLTGFFKLQRYFWDSYFDYGRSSTAALSAIMLGHKPYNQPILLVTGVVVISVAVLVVLAAMHRTPWVLIVFAVMMFIGSVGSHANFSAMERHLLPVFPALVVPAAVLARARPQMAGVVLFVLALLSGWYGGWLPFSSGNVI